MKELKRNLLFVLVTLVLASIFFGFFNAVLTLNRDNGILLAILCYAGFPIALGFAVWKSSNDVNWMDKGILIGASCIMVPCCEHLSQDYSNHEWTVVVLFLITIGITVSSLEELRQKWPVESGWTKVRSLLLGISILALAGVVPISILLEYVITGGIS